MAHMAHMSIKVKALVSAGWKSVAAPKDSLNPAIYMLIHIASC